MTLFKDFLHFPGNASIAEPLQVYQDKPCQWFWLLLIESNGSFKVCSFGSLLPYITGRMPDIAHNIGDCPICSGMDPLLFAETDALVAEALADPAIRSLLLRELPAADCPIIAKEDMEIAGSEAWLLSMSSRVCAVTTGGNLSDVSYQQMR